MSLGVLAAIGGVGASLFGANQDRKASDRALREQRRQNESNEAFIREQAGKARQDILPLFDNAAQNRILGSQAALDIFGQSLPAQAQAFQQGNVGAQQSLLAGLPQVQNAILGNPVDLSGLQPQQLNVDTSFMQQQLPQFNTANPESMRILEMIGNAVNQNRTPQPLSREQQLQQQSQAFFDQLGWS